MTIVSQPNPSTASLFAGDVELPLESVDIEGIVDGNGIVWTINQTYVNTLDDALEAVYKFPLPIGGAVHKVTMKIGDRKVVADIRRREEARTEYEEAVALGYTATLTEQDAGEMFTTAVGNIHPGEAISIEIVVHDTVLRDRSEASLRFPTLVKPRYVPADMPGADALQAPRHHGEVHVNSTVRVAFTEPVNDLVCDTVESALLAPACATITDFALDRDIVLRWHVPAEVTDAKWTADALDPSVGTVEVVIRRDTDQDRRALRRRALAVILDHSGSMSGWNMEAARRVAADCVGSLSVDDLVYVLTFDDEMSPLSSTEHGFVAANARTKAAIKSELHKVEAEGGTELDTAITVCGAALATLDDRDDSEQLDRVVLLLTDGAYGDEATAARQREIELRGARLIVVGIGQEMNGYLHTLAANGWFTSVSAQHRADDVSAQVRERIGQPAHRGARINMPGLVQQAPSLAPDIYPGTTVTLSGRAPRPAEGSSLSITTDEGELATVPVRIADDPSATTRWAKALINSLDYDVMTGRAPAHATSEEIVRLSLAFRVLSKYTAWLAVDTSRTTDSIVPVRVEQPSLDLRRGFRRLSTSLLPSVVSCRGYGVQAESLVFERSSRDVAGDLFDGTLSYLASLRDCAALAIAEWESRGDLSSVDDFLEELEVWLDGAEGSRIGRRNHGKLARRLHKLRVGGHRPHMITRILQEIVEILDSVSAPSGV